MLGSVVVFGAADEPFGVKIAHEVITIETKIMIVSNLKVEFFIAFLTC